MKVTSYDICVPGFERLRSQNETLFTTPVCKKTSIKMISSDFEDRVKSLGCDYDHQGLRRAIATFLDDYGHSLVHEMRDIEPGDGDDDQTWCHLFVYVADESDDETE